MNKSAYKGIWIYAEQTNGVLSRASLELLAKAHDLKKKLGGQDDVIAVLLGKDVSALADELFTYGAERVILCENEALAQYKHRVYTEALVKLAEKHMPSIILLPATAAGRELAPRVMCRLNTGLTADAIDLDVDEDGTFVQTTPNFGGCILSHIAIPERRPQMCTVHPGVFEPFEPTEGASGEIVVENLELSDDDSYVILSSSEKTFSDTPISKASIVVSGGYGIKDEAELAQLRTLADLIGGQVGCSRPLYEKGWFGHEKQIGQSGSTIAPELIINIAISGSIQYVAGMEKSKCIMSVNKDQHAPIFDVSNYGAVADYKALLPAIIEEIKQRKQK